MTETTLLLNLATNGSMWDQERALVRLDDELRRIARARLQSFSADPNQPFPMPETTLLERAFQKTVHRTFRGKRGSWQSRVQFLRRVERKMYLLMLTKVSRMRRRQPLPDDLPTRTPAIPESLAAQEQLRRIRRAIRALPEPLKGVI